VNWLIKNGRVIDPGRVDAVADVLVHDGCIREIRIHQPGHIDPALPDTECHIIDASGKIVSPGLIDMHVHLREPGQEHKETIDTGCAAAASGGFTAVCAMPNTDPVNDCAQITRLILDRAEQADATRVFPVSAISKGLLGKELCDFNELKKAGVIAVSDDGRPVTNNRMMQLALVAAAEAGLLVISHSEDIDLAGDGVMNDGPIARKMGFPGIPNAAESIAVERDISLCELTGIPLHVAHVSTLESIRAVRAAKQRGVPVTAETAPHYFTLTDEAVETFGTNAKMNPPLRSQKDREAVIEGLADNTIDVIATDHAPHAPYEKDADFRSAPNGIIGLETSVPLSLRLVETGVITMADLIVKMSKNPAKILGIENGLKPGNPADLTIIDPERVHTIDADRFRSKSRNTPFDGRQVKGKAVLTMVGGRIVYQDDR
jgi:dihydroorotase